VPGLDLVLTMTEDRGWDGETRRIEPDMLRDHLGEDLNAYTYLVAGPPPMVESVVESLKGAGIPEDQIRPDRFSGY
jgi:NAD(P)H-flavin reductase